MNELAIIFISSACEVLSAAQPSGTFFHLPRPVGADAWTHIISLPRPEIGYHLRSSSLAANQRWHGRPRRGSVALL